MAEITVGLKGTEEMKVQRHHLASLMGNIGVPVLSTHHVVLLMELAARKAVTGLLPEGKMTVGTVVKVRHLAAAPLGAQIRAEGLLKKIEGNSLFFDVVAYDGSEKISEGENEQRIVSQERFVRKVVQKQLHLTVAKHEDGG
jgi:fluoroacetyl-CoA thioesterase